MKKGIHRISDFYKPLNNQPEISLHKFSPKAWIKELQIDQENYTASLEGYLDTLKHITNEFWREQQYKILHRAYIPHLPHATQQNKTLCLLCASPRPNLTHKLWSCPFIVSFWDLVERYVFEITGLNPHKSTDLLVFGDTHSLSLSLPNTQLTILQKHKSWIVTCYMIARRLILRNWTSTISPSISDLHADLHKLFKLEKKDFYIAGSMSRDHFTHKWSSFQNYSLTPPTYTPHSPRDTSSLDRES